VLEHLNLTTYIIFYCTALHCTVLYCTVVLYVYVAYCYRLSMSTVVCSICRSICHDHEPCKMAETIEMPFGMWTQVGSRNPVLEGIQIPSTDNFRTKRVRLRTYSDMSGSQYTH